jgi:hypothetical protein
VAWKFEDDDATTINRFRSAFIMVVQTTQPEWFREHLSLEGNPSGNDGNEDATASATKCTYVWNEEVRDEIGVVAKPRDEIGFVVKPRDAEADDADEAGGATHEIRVAKLRCCFGILEKPLPRAMLGDTFTA